MNTRSLPNQHFSLTEIGLGCWQLGGGWEKPWSDDVAQEILEAAYESGTRFIETADVYADGESERSIGRFLKSHTDCFVVRKLGNSSVVTGLPFKTRIFLSRKSSEHIRGPY